MKTLFTIISICMLTACTTPAIATANEPANTPQIRTTVSPTLAGEWRIIQINSQKLPTDSNARIHFDTARSAFNAGVGCNGLFGGYETGAGKLKFGMVASTLMACEPELMKREQALSSTLRQTVAYEFDHDALVLKDKQGKTLLKAVK